MGGDLLRYEPVRRSFEVSSAAYKGHHNHQDGSVRTPQEDCNGQMELSSEEEGETVMDSAIKAGADVVLSKPLKITTVERALDEALGPKWREIASAFSSPSTSCCLRSRPSPSHHFHNDGGGLLLPASETEGECW